MMVVLVVVLVIICLLLVFRLKQQQERVSALYKSDKLKSHFVKSLVYEIRNPLQSVMKLAEMVGRKDLYLSKEEKKHVADQISYHSSLMDTLLDEVEVYADSNKKGHEITDERFSPNRVCERCIDANLHNVPEGVKMSFRQETGQGVFVSADRHIVEDNPTADELAAWQAASGLPVRRFFNTSGKLYRELGVKAKLDAGMSDEEAFALLSTEGMLVKRPIVVGEDFVLVGFKEPEWEKALL
jgi:arsenate reductase